MIEMLKYRFEYSRMERCLMQFKQEVNRYSLFDQAKSRNQQVWKCLITEMRKDGNTQEWKSSIMERCMMQFEQEASGHSLFDQARNKNQQVWKC